MKFLAPILVAFAVLVFAPCSMADPVARVALHVDDNDPKRINLVLNNASNIHKY